MKQGKKEKIEKHLFLVVWSEKNKSMRSLLNYCKSGDYPVNIFFKVLNSKLAESI